MMPRSQRKGEEVETLILPSNILAEWQTDTAVPGKYIPASRPTFITKDFASFGKLQLSRYKKSLQKNPDINRYCHFPVGCMNKKSLRQSYVDVVLADFYTRVAGFLEKKAQIPAIAIINVRLETLAMHNIRMRSTEYTLCDFGLLLWLSTPNDKLFRKKIDNSFEKTMFFSREVPEQYFSIG